MLVRMDKFVQTLDEFPEYTFKATGKVLDGRKFISTHLRIAKAHVGNPSYYPYLARLREYLTFCHERTRST